MRKIRLNERDLQSIVRRVVNESQLLNEEAPCTTGGHEECGGCVKMGNDFTRAGGNGNSFIDKVCFGEGKDGQGKTTGGEDCGPGETIGTNGDCICVNPKLCEKSGGGRKHYTQDGGRVAEGAYRRWARNRRR